MSFDQVELPHIDKRVPRLVVSGNYGLDDSDIRYASERGIRFWVGGSTPGYRPQTAVLREILTTDRDQHVVGVFLGLAYTAGMVRRAVEGWLRKLKIDYLDIALLAWLGRMSALTGGVADLIETLKDEGKVRVFGTSIHDRPRAGRLARDSVLDALMIRYNAKHPGAEQDIFPHLAERNPVIMAYTATSWRQLLKPIAKLDMPPWPGETSGVPPLSAELCYRFCLSSPHVHAVLTGPKSREQLEENLRLLETDPLSPAEEKWVRQYGAELKARKRFGFP